MAARDRFFGFWCRHLRQALGLSKKLGTWKGRAALGHSPVPASRFASVGAEVRCALGAGCRVKGWFLSTMTYCEVGQAEPVAACSIMHGC